MNQSAQQLQPRTTEEDPGVFALATNKRRGGRPLLLPTASLSATDTRTQSSRTLDVFAARSLAVGRVRIFVMVYLGHVAGRPRPRGEVRGVRAASVAALLQVSPLSAKASLMNVVPGLLSSPHFVAAHPHHKFLQARTVIALL